MTTWTQTHSYFHTPTTISALQLTLTISLATLAGIAICLHSWVVPILRLGATSRCKIAQFNLVISLGFTYLQSAGRLLGLLTAIITGLFYTHPDPVVAQQWRTYAAVLAMLAPLAPYEEYTIFPINNRIKRMGEQLAKEGKEMFRDARDGELTELLGSWQAWHTGRAVAPFVAACVAGWAMIGV